MRRIEVTNAFKRDFNRESKGRHKAVLSNDFTEVVQTLANDEPLEERYRNHPLAGEWRDCYDCHIKPDLVLIYRKDGDGVLQLVRIGSHSELGL